MRNAVQHNVSAFFPCVLNFHMVSLVRCGTWLYQFLILAFFFFTFFGSDRPKEKSYNSTLQIFDLFWNTDTLIFRAVAQWYWDRGSSGSSLTGVIVSLSKNINLSLVLVQPRDRSLITERLLMGRKVSNQTKTKSNLWDWSSFKKVRPDFFELFTLIGIEFATRMIKVTQVRVQTLLEMSWNFSGNICFNSRIPFLLGQFNTAADVVVLGRLRLRPLQYVPAYSM